MATVQETEVVDAERQVFLRVYRNALDFARWESPLVVVFQNKIIIIILSVVGKNRNDVVAFFHVGFQLEVTIVAARSDEVSGHMTMVTDIGILWREFTFSAHAGPCLAVRSFLFSG